MNPKVIGKKGSVALQLRIAAEYANCKIDVVDQAHTDVLPAVVVTAQGSPLWDVQSGLRYFARMLPDMSLYGRNLDESARVDAWMSFAQNNNLAKYLPTMLEPHLLHHTFVASERLTVADLHLAVVVGDNAELASLLGACPNTQRWFRTVTGLPIVKKYLDEETQQSCPKSNKQHHVAKVTVPETKAKEPTTAADIEDQIAAEEKAKAKKANPLDSLPPTPLVLDAWKREYSNTKDLRGQAMPWFWNNFDPAGYSLWYMRYDKMEGENTVGFTTANMLNGFLQRLDAAFRKYSFAVLNVVGDGSDFDIQGVWLLRGQEIPFELKDHPSFEYYAFRKLDAVADKALIEDYWCNEDAVEGRKIDSCKVYK